MSAVPRSELAAEGRSDPGGYRLLAIALAVTALAYLGTLRFGFVYDDLPQIVSNPTLLSWRSLPFLFSGNTWSFLIPGWAGNYYRPIFMTWLLVNRILWGLNPAAWHASSLVLHLLATWMAFLVARGLLNRDTSAFIVCLLFGLHPVHIESVAWISGATDPLMAFFTLAAFWAWIRGDKAGSGYSGWRGLASLLYLLACLSKETALLLPVVIVGYGVLYAGESSALGAALRTWPLWLSTAAYLLVRWVVLRGLMHPVGVPSALLTIPTILCGYFRRLVWPVSLSVFYDTPPVARILDWRFLVPMAALIGGALVLYRCRRSRLVLFSFLWMLCFLLPALAGLPLFYVGEWMHDRYLYLPSFGFCLLLGLGIGRLQGERKIYGFTATGLAATFVAAALMILGTTWQQQYWSNPLLLFVHSVNAAPRSPWAKGYLASELLRRGDRANAARMYQAALEIDPGNWKNNTAYALMLYDEGNYREADEHFTRAVSVDPTDPNTHFNQGMSRFNYGNYSGAEISFREALDRNPMQKQAHYWLGLALERQGNLEAARLEYLKEIEQHSEVAANAEARLNELSSRSNHGTRAK